LTEPRLLDVLVVSGGGFQGLGIVKCLRDSDRIRVVVADIHEDNVTRYFAEAFHRVPPVRETEAFIAALRDICAREGVRLVIPATAFELLALAEHEPALRGDGVRVAVSSAAFVRLAGDKSALYPFLASKGLPVLPPVDTATEARFPLLGKPPGGCGSRGLTLVRSPSDLERVPADVRASLVWQDYLEDADELSADFSIDFAGALSPIGVRRRVRVAGGFAAIADDDGAADVTEVVERLAAEAAALGACGPLNVQVLRRGRELFVSDVNARAGTSAVHWCGTPVNPVLHVCRSVEPSLAAVGPARPAPRRMVRYLEERWVEPPGARLPLTPPIKAVVFDLDDTLLRQKLWILETLERLHVEAGHTLPDRAAFLSAALQVLEEGQPAALFDVLAVRFGWDEARKEHMIAAYRAAAPETSRAVYPDVWPVLDTLRLAGLRLALLTDNPPDSQRRKLAATGLAGWFEVVVFSREAGAEKPDRRGFDAVADRLGVDPSDLAMVGDNPHRDAAGALGAGWALAYVVRRTETLLRFDAELGRAWLPTPERVRIIEGLRPLLGDLAAT